MIHILILKKKVMIKILNLKFVIMWEFLNTRMFLLKDICQIGQRKYSLLRKLKTLCHGHVINDLNGEENNGTFYEQELQGTSQQEFRIEKVIKEKVINYVKWKGYDNSFNSWIDKKYIV